MRLHYTQLSRGTTFSSPSRLRN